jgi:hypothetical protein
MPPLAFSPERRAELAELLGDERRLEVEYPRVAEYLDAAPAMPGTGDDQADREFDLRVLHYMTGGRSVSDNPYWDIVAPSVSSDGPRRIVNGGTSLGSARLAYAQTVLQSAYAYAIPSPETVDWVSQFCDGRPIVEIGAGRGYWAWQLSRAGVRVDAYDVEPPDKVHNVSFPPAIGQADAWHDVSGLDQFTDRVAGGADSVLFLCWPPGWENTMATDALDAFEAAGGTRLVYIGEPEGGKTANSAFFNALSSRWRLASVDEEFVSWWNLADVAQAWVRR